MKPIDLIASIGFIFVVFAAGVFFGNVISAPTPVCPDPTPCFCAPCGFAERPNIDTPCATPSQELFATDTSGPIKINWVIKDQPDSGSLITIDQLDQITKEK